MVGAFFICKYGTNLKDDFYAAVNKEALNSLEIKPGKMMAGTLYDLSDQSGEKEYSVIIPKETAELVLKRKGEKYVAPSDSQKKLRDEYRAKVRCSVCGSKMMRQHAGGRGISRLYWKCTNHNCVESRHGLNETILDSLMAQTLNEI